MRYPVAPPPVSTRRLSAVAVGLVTVLSAWCWAPVARAQDLPEIPPDPRIETDTGRLKANWPPATHFDHLHMRLAMDFGALDTPTYTGVQTLRLSARGKPREVLVLDAGPGIKVSAVQFPAVVDEKGREKHAAVPLRFTHAGSELRVTLPTPAEPGERFEVRIEYVCDFGDQKGEGLTYSPGKPEAKSPTDRAPMVHSQGQAQHNHRWFPCHDYPNERVTTEIVATVPAGFEVCSNGRLVNKVTEGGRTTFHWLQDKPHVYYLVSVVVGQFSILNLARPEEPADMRWPRDGRFRLPVTAYVPIGKETQASRSLRSTVEMIPFFEGFFDEPYPWDKYATVLVRGFGGGMENTSATTMYDGLADQVDGSGEGIIAHELAHQWMGDLVTCRGWAHLWINEGWATYSEALWEEHKSGGKVGDAELADKAYLGAVVRILREQRVRNRGSLPGAIPMVSNRYANPDTPFSKADNVYSKGAVVLHMLREKLGTEAFTRGTRLFIDRHKFGLADTDDFRRALESASGLALERFFEQWCLRPGLPRLDVELTYDGASGTLTVSARQTQKIDRENPAYDLDLPVRIAFEDGTFEMVRFRSDTAEAVRTYPLRASPSDVVVDPRASTLAAVSVKKPLSMWLEQFDNPPTVIARVRALEYLASVDAPEARARVARAADDPDPEVRAWALDLSLDAATPLAAAETSNGSDPVLAR
ncbi:MAG: M1 family metallopeptidase [Phycisphaeraceae bacterium]|nr:MAG: M1 family metallopeptidase [Phycisphaeraceae bacterium]